MEMTHYMELLSTNQPWNLLLFMAVPVILAETLAISELYLLYTRHFDGFLRKLNRVVGIMVGIYFIGVICYLLVNSVIPITQNEQWRGIIDITAVSMYLISGLPLIFVALLDLDLVARKKSEVFKLALHVTCISLFLVFGHIAMIAGMANPYIFQNKSPAENHMNMNMDMH
jgi:L-cystine uptake protein TcyP (sodium:dicarboxylate symporter family)